MIQMFRVMKLYILWISYIYYENYIYYEKFVFLNCTCYYSDDIIKFEHFNCDNILIDLNYHENILIYNISNKTLIGAKPLYITFNQGDGFMRVYDGSKYLVLFDSEQYDTIYNRIRYLII